MRQSLTSVLVGLALAIFVAAGITAVAHLGLAGPPEDYAPGQRFAMALLAVAAFSGLPALAAIALGEARRIKGLPYWLGAGLLIALAGFAWWAATGVGEESESRGVAAAEFAAAGLAGGYVYWRWVGRNSGRVAAALQASSDLALSPASADRRCRICTLVSLTLGIAPLGLLGWTAINRPLPGLIDQLDRRAENDAQSWLIGAGLASLSLKIEDGVGKVTGTAPSGTTAASAFERSSDVLRPLTGMPGIVTRLENAIGSDGDRAPER